MPKNGTSAPAEDLRRRWLSVDRSPFHRRVQRLGRDFSRRHSVQHLVAQTPGFGVCGDLRDWWAGTAKDAHAPFFERHLAADLGDGLSYREAYTTDAAAEVIEHLVNKDGFRLDHEAVPEPGKIVIVYRHGV